MPHRDRTNAVALARRRLVKSEEDSQEREDKIRLESNSAAPLQLESRLLFISMLDESGDLTDNQLRFLGEFAKDGLHLRACERSRVSPSTYYGWVRNNSEFKAALEECRKYANEGLEGYALDMANGVFKKPIASAGKVVAYEEIRDTKMLAMVMRARMPERYGQRMDITTGGQSLIKYVDKDTWDAI
jgi:hypothetical protein